MDNATASKRLVDIPGIDTEPVAVFRLVFDMAFPTSSFKEVIGHRYCRLIMRARLAQEKELTQIRKKGGLK